MAKRTPRQIVFTLTVIAASALVGVICASSKMTHYFGRTLNPVGVVVDPIATIAPPPGAPKLRILFYGNSYTFVNDLPHQIANLAATDPQNPIDIQVYSVTQGGATLSDLWAQPRAHDPLAKFKWDYVVLQELSMSATMPELTWYMHQAFTNFNREIRAAGAKPIVYGTWARKPGSSWYTDTRTPSLHQYKRAEDMQLQVDKVTNAYAAEIQAPVIPVGDYFMMCKDQPGMPQLYNPDGTHASPAGTYLAALVFYRKLTGNPVDRVTYVPAGINANDAATLRKCAS